MSREQFNAYINMITSPAGLVLITGPTGSGKSATLYSSLFRLNDGKIGYSVLSQFDDKTLNVSWAGSAQNNAYFGSFTL